VELAKHEGCSPPLGMGGPGAKPPWLGAPGSQLKTEWLG